MNIRARQPEDLDSVRTLLEGADLPSKGLERTEGWVAEENGRLVGHVALERTADAAVLRSLAIAPAAQGRGLARRLMDLAESEAGNRALVLRTLTIGPWAERRGYFRANPDQIPESILNCPTSSSSPCPRSPVEPETIYPQWSVLFASMAKSSGGFTSWMHGSFYDPGRLASSWR